MELPSPAQHAGAEPAPHGGPDPGEPAGSPANPSERPDSASTITRRPAEPGQRFRFPCSAYDPFPSAASSRPHSAPNPQRRGSGGEPGLLLESRGEHPGCRMARDRRLEPGAWTACRARPARHGTALSLGRAGFTPIRQVSNCVPGPAHRGLGSGERVGCAAATFASGCSRCRLAVSGRTVVSRVDPASLVLLVQLWGHFAGDQLYLVQVAQVQQL